MTELVRVPSKGFYNLLDKIADNQKTTKESFQEAVTLARREKFTDLEIALLMKDYLRDKVPRRTLSGWVKELEPKDEIEYSSIQSGQSAQNDDNNDTGDESETEEAPDTFDKKSMTIVKDSTQFYKEQQVYPSKQAEDEPSPLELAEIKIAQLEDALHKTQQFKPAREIVPLHGVIEEAEVFDWLRKRDNQQSQFFYDSYGIDLFKNRIVPQLKNSGVTVFKRLYFEV